MQRISAVVGTTLSHDYADMPTAFGGRVAQQRKRLGMSQPDLVDRLRGRGIKASTTEVSRVETGTVQSPSVPRLVAYAVILGVSTDYLLGLTDDPTPPPRSAARAAEELAHVAHEGP